MGTRTKKDRESLAKRVLAVASYYGAVAERFSKHGDNPREIHVRIDTGRLKCSFTINSMVQEENVFVLPWNTIRPMDPAVVPHCNPYHHRKNTEVLMDKEELITHITAMLALDKSGDLYMKGEKE